MTAHDRRARRILVSEQVQPATLTCTPIEPVSGGELSLGDFLTHVCSSWSGELQGLAFATNGTWPVLGIDKCSPAETPKLSVTPIDGRHFEPTKVYELRLWIPVKLPDEHTEGNVLACEYRWVNGVGAVELRITAGTDSSQTNGSKGSGDRGWMHAVQYLEHVPSSRSTANPGAESTDNQSNQSGGRNGGFHMTALEFIQAEDKYGNTVVIDQLFTGKWN